jgi:hypothetical protein
MNTLLCWKCKVGVGHEWVGAVSAASSGLLWEAPMKKSGFPCEIPHGLDTYRAVVDQSILYDLH